MEVNLLDLSMAGLQAWLQLLSVTQPMSAYLRLRQESPARICVLCPLLLLFPWGRDGWEKPPPHSALTPPDGGGGWPWGQNLFPLPSLPRPLCRAVLAAALGLTMKADFLCPGFPTQICVWLS